MANGLDDGNTVLLWHCDADRRAGEAGVWWEEGNRHIGGVAKNETYKKFGTASAYFNRQRVVTTDNLTPLNFGSGAYTVDFWFYKLNNRYAYMWAFGSGSNNRIYGSQSGAGNTISWSQEYGGSITWTLTIPAGWNHYAFVCDGSLWKFFFNGVQQSGTLTRIALPQAPTEFAFGHNADTGTAGFDGYIDEFRISNIARWSSDFTPPTQAYGDSLSPKLLAYGGPTVAVNFTGADAGICMTGTSVTSVSINSVPMDFCATHGTQKWWILRNPPQGSYAPVTSPAGGAVTAAFKRINMYRGGGNRSGTGSITCTGAEQGDVWLGQIGAGGQGFGVGFDGTSIYYIGTTYEQGWSWKYGIRDTYIYAQTSSSSSQAAAFYYIKPSTGVRVISFLEKYRKEWLKKKGLYSDLMRQGAVPIGAQI